MRTCIEMKELGSRGTVLAALALLLVGCVGLRPNDPGPVESGDGGGDARTDAEASRTDDASPGEPCVSTCDNAGAFRCSDPTHVQVCDALADCLVWRDVGGCPSQHACCSGLCVKNDVTLPSACDTVPLPGGYDLYVSATGSDAPGREGTIDRPFRTVTRALAIAPTLMDAGGGAVRIYVARGTYDRALGEVFPLVVPGNVSLVGAGAGMTVLAGASSYDLTAVGGPANTEAFLTVVAGDPSLPTDISDMSIAVGDTVPGRVHYGVYCNHGPAVADGGSDEPNTTLRNLTIGPGFWVPIYATNPLHGPGCNLKLSGSTLVGGKYGILDNCGDDFTPDVRLTVGDGTPEGGNLFKYQTTEFGAGSGIGLSCSRRLTASYNTFTDGNRAVFFTGDRRARLKLDHNTFENLSHGGVTVGGGELVLDVMDNVFSNISRVRLAPTAGAAYALSIGPDTNGFFPIAKLRNNVFFRNDTGIYIFGYAAVMMSSATGDFGASRDDPGNNQFHCNGAGVPADLVKNGAGGALVIDLPNALPSVTFHFQGNQWDHEPPGLSMGKADTGWAMTADIMTRVDNVLVDVQYPGPKLPNDCP
jgi:hypothetical protein